jgi:hypothetical protein
MEELLKYFAKTHSFLLDKAKSDNITCIHRLICAARELGIYVYVCAYFTL